MTIMYEEITEDPYDNNERRNYKRHFMIIMNEEIIKGSYDNNERRNYKRP